MKTEKQLLRRIIANGPDGQFNKFSPITGAMNAPTPNIKCRVCM